MQKLDCGTRVPTTISCTDRQQNQFAVLATCTTFLKLLNSHEHFGRNGTVQSNAPVLDFANDASAAGRRDDDLATGGEAQTLQMLFRFFVGNYSNNFQRRVRGCENERHVILLVRRVSSRLCFCIKNVKFVSLSCLLYNQPPPTVKQNVN